MPTYQVSFRIVGEQSCLESYVGNLENLDAYKARAKVLSKKYRQPILIELKPREILIRVNPDGSIEGD